MWTIEIDYETGSSFHNETVHGEQVGYCWKSQEDAKTALTAIKEQDEYVDLTEGYYYGKLTKAQREARVKEIEKSSWFNKEYPTYSLNVPGNDGEDASINSFWVGYFEQLHEARVVPVKGTDDGLVYSKDHF